MQHLSGFGGRPMESRRTQEKKDSSLAKSVEILIADPGDGAGRCRRRGQ